MSSENEDNGFSYTGHLVYNEVCRTNQIGDDHDLPTLTSELEGELLEILPDFEQGKPLSPGKGYEKLLLRDHTTESGLPSETKEFINSLVCLQYLQEDFDSQEAFVDGERKDVQVSTVKDSNVFWDFDQYMLFRGSESDASAAKGQTQTALGESFGVHSITFSGEFLLWMFYQAHQDPQLSDTLKIEQLQDAEVTGSPDAYGREATVHESDDIKQSPAILLGILNGKDLSMLEGDFTLDLDSTSSEDKYTKATIRTEIQRNKIQVKASKAGLSNASKVEKLSLATHITREFAALYEYWADLDPHNSDKHVPPTFLVELIRTCRDKEIRYEHTPTTLLEQQASLRGDDIDDYDLSI